MNRLLAIDTTTEACSVALATDAGTVARSATAGHRHSGMVLAMVEEVLAEADYRLATLSAIACCRGPGSFTGVRISVGVAQGLALGAGLGVIPVSTLATVARGACREHGVERVAVAMDARMGEVYWGCFWWSGQCLVPAAAERVCQPGMVSLPGEGAVWHGTGTGFSAHGEELGGILGERLVGTDPGRLPDAVDCLALAREAGTAPVSPEAVIPAYLRDRVAGGP
ncbi:tRNA (adenosine(37)-N6)-threonylcarbamoyltransferase complex dimerization subunit type 1 TsaB [Arhodomonas sp. SL1]|uniref:tRNA (adenosine(37)-N6)-threonylcarbamoyltransferase complex dimerization subunit type 1 TsaB n=1 Tax=Arhodomonas sp. SL1 TaxID=3425691 RepID=UPI003F880A85